MTALADTFFGFHGHSNTISLFLSFLLLIINQTISCWNTAHCNSPLLLSKFNSVLSRLSVLTSHLNAEHSSPNPLKYHCPGASFWGLILKLLETSQTIWGILSFYRDPKWQLQEKISSLKRCLTADSENSRKVSSLCVLSVTVTQSYLVWTPLFVEVDKQQTLFFYYYCHAKCDTAASHFFTVFCLFCFDFFAICPQHFCLFSPKRKCGPSHDRELSCMLSY